MKKFHDLKPVVVNHVAINYFYTREKNDINGNPRYRVYIMDTEAPAVVETIAKTYCLDSWIKSFIERGEDQ